MAAPTDVALWLQALIEREHPVPVQQSLVVELVQQRFGEEFVYENKRGNLAIRADVLKAFRAITDKTIVWDRGQGAWRRRRSEDPVGRSVD